jgi:hypothetical protein
MPPKPTQITHTDGIWISSTREISVIKQLDYTIQKQKFVPVRQDSNNYGYPYVYQRDHIVLGCRMVDSVFFPDPESWTRVSPCTIITDNIPIRAPAGNLISVLPEFWSIWQFDPVYTDQPAVWAYNCFMNRPRGDRSRIFYELIKRNLLCQGLVSFNLTQAQCQQQYVELDMASYQKEHAAALDQVPYNNLTASLEQCIIDSRVSLVLETYISDSHVVFSEKIFRCLQLPRPWLLYCSPLSVKYLRDYGFDVLDEYTDNHAYDTVFNHGRRLLAILNQLERFVHQDYSDKDYARFQDAAKHNQKLLLQFAQSWPDKFAQVLSKIENI